MARETTRSKLDGLMIASGATAHLPPLVREYLARSLPSEAWWDLPDGRFVYWRGRVSALELAGG